MKQYIQILLSYIRYEFHPKNKNIIIFSGYDNLKYNFNSKYLFEYFIKRAHNFKLFFIIDNEDLRRELCTKIGDFFITTKNKSDLKIIFSAFTWITSGGLPIRIPYANRNRVVVNLWHGLPFKGIGILNGENTPLQNLLIRWVYSKYDIISSTSEVFQQIFAKSFSVNLSNVKILGQAWNDQLWNNNNRIEIFYSLYGIKITSKDKIFLYAPTWRNGKKTFFFPFPDFSTIEFENFLESNNIYICMRTHQLDVGNIEKFNNYRRILLLNEDKVSDIMSILNIFDGLISDYSGIIFDYLLLNRPIILIPYDKDDYFHSRKTNFCFDDIEFMQSPRDMKSFISLLNTSIGNYTISNKQYNFKNIAHLYHDCHSCERHYREIMKTIEHKS